MNDSRRRRRRPIVKRGRYSYDAYHKTRRGKGKWITRSTADGKLELINTHADADAKRAEREQRRADARWEQEHRGEDRPRAPIIVHAEPEEIEHRHGHWLERRGLVRQALILTEIKARSLEAFDNCGGDAWVERFTDEEGGWRVCCQHCKNRWCEPCGNARSLLIADNLRTRIDNEPHLHVVLTLKHRDEPLKPQVDRLYACFKKLRGTKLWKNATDGGAAFFQAHVAADGCWHPHLHIACRGKWLNAALLSSQWHRITGDSTNVHVSAVASSEKLVKEVTRYVSRPADEGTIHDAAKLAEMIKALRGRHLCYTFGRWRKFRLTAKPTEPRRPTERVIALKELIRRSQHGDAWAGKLLDLITARKCSARPPPEDDHYFCA